jgi:hypothetical protein
MSNMTRLRSGLAAAGAALTPQNLANNKKHPASHTSTGTLYYYSRDIFFPDRHARHADIRRMHGEPSRRHADQYQTGAAPRRALSVSPFA